MKASKQHAKPHSKVTSSIDLLADGKAFGYLSVPHSHDESAWGSVRVPIVRIANGAGNGLTVLLTGGNHGDEYEGPIALIDLARSLSAEDLQGRVYIMPALNFPAIQAGRRTSPIDGGNMNRAFPGDPRGSITEMIADFVYRELVLRADAVIDIHSGGRTLTFAPSVIVHELDDTARMQATLAALQAFNAPYGLVLRELDPDGLLDTVAEDAGKLFLSTELGGGGSTTPATVGIAKRGVLNVLRHLQVLTAETQSTTPVQQQTRLMTTTDHAFTACDEHGIVEFCVDVGSEVRAGDLLAKVHHYDRPQQAARIYHARCDGVLIGRHFPGLVQRGDCLSVIASDYAPRPRD